MTLTAEEAGLARVCGWCGERMIWGELAPALTSCRVCGTRICACCGRIDAQCTCASEWDPALDGPIHCSIADRLAALCAATDRREQYLAQHGEVYIEQIGGRRQGSRTPQGATIDLATKPGPHHPVTHGAQGERQQ